MREHSFDIERHRTKYIQQASSIPSRDVLERSLRYETSLSREFDRTLNQLERSQRMRLGQTVPPPVKVELSS